MKINDRISFKFAYSVRIKDKNQFHNPFLEVEVHLPVTSELTSVVWCKLPSHNLTTPEAELPELQPHLNPRAVLQTKFRPKPHLYKTQTQTMDFAPYQDQSPETHRALSPPPNDRRSSSISRIRSPPPQSPTKPSAPNLWPPSTSQAQHAEDSSFASRAFGSAGLGLESGRGQLNEFETSLPIRLDHEACLAYLMLPPAGAVLLLLVEQKSDYVR